MERWIANFGRTSSSLHAHASWSQQLLLGGRLGLLLMMALMVGCQPWSSGAESRGKSARDEFASERETTAVDPVAFDGKRAMGYLEDICKIGPRISGSDGMKKQQELLEKYFKDLGGKIEWQRFEAKQRSRRDKVEMANLIVSWNP